MTKINRSAPINLLNYIGDRNPQLWRELKRQFKLRYLVRIISISGALQFCLLLIFHSKLTAPLNPGDYCFTSAGCAIDWQRWWLDIFRLLNWVIAFLLIVPSTYLLATDLQTEERRHTLDVLRLTPQPVLKLLIGKMLGVPISAYCAVATFLPLHWIAANGAGVSWGFRLSYYLAIANGAYFFLSLALFFGLINKASTPKIQGTATIWLFVGLVAAIGVPAYLSWNLVTTWNADPIYFIQPPRSGNLQLNASISWFFLPLSEIPLLSLIFISVTVSLFFRWLWQILSRCFYRIGDTILPKQQSYWFIGCTQIWLLGFFIPSSFESLSSRIYLFGVISFFNLLLFLFSIAALTPHRQALIDWARDRSVFVLSSDLIQELISVDRAPALGAIALNLIVVTVIQWIWVFGGYFLGSIALIMQFNLILIYGAIAQSILLSKHPKRSLFANLAVLSAILLPLIALVALFTVLGASANGINSVLLLFSPLFWLPLERVGSGIIFLGLLGQWTILGWLCFSFIQRLQVELQDRSLPESFNSLV
ncbi:MAG: hypothetical protein KME17_13995 [Cyanosarcina radialis HA8281-LM2]|jgi:hypothetical protein|nr:hypothetical protein [Cyanosarcina radialis HA8281-LM2]